MGHPSCRCASYRVQPKIAAPLLNPREKFGLDRLVDPQVNLITAEVPTGLWQVDDIVALLRENGDAHRNRIRHPWQPNRV